MGFMGKCSCYLYFYGGYAVAQLVEAPRYQPENRGFGFQRFFIDLIVPATLWNLF
jgi:hypothetical protein